MWTRVASLNHSAPTVIERAATRAMRVSCSAMTSCGALRAPNGKNTVARRAMRAGVTSRRQKAYDCTWLVSSLDAVNPVRSQRPLSSTGRSGVNGPNTESFMTMTSAPGERRLRWRSASVYAEKS